MTECAMTLKSVLKLSRTTEDFHLIDVILVSWMFQTMSTSRGLVIF